MSKENCEIEIIREAIVAWVIIKTHDIHGKPIVGILALNHGWEFDFYTLENYEETDEIVAVIPAQPGTYIVIACSPEKCVELGYELPGAYHPDWIEIAKKKLCRKANSHVL